MANITQGKIPFGLSRLPRPAGDGASFEVPRSAQMQSSIAFVGAGPTTIHTLKSLVEHAGAGARVVIFERKVRAGLGTPYRPGWNDPAMLSNIASVEIPPLKENVRP